LVQGRGESPKTLGKSRGLGSGCPGCPINWARKPDSRLSCQKWVRAIPFCCISELNDGQTRDVPEMAHIDREHRVAERERRRTDEEIGQRNDDSPALLLRIQLAREPCNVRGQRIDRDGGKKLLDESFTARAAFGGISAVDSVDEFDDPDSRNSGLLVAGRIDDTLEKGFNSVTAALGRNRDTRIEN
jgi:hypothetical protein